jgi:hypothetical protein
MNKIYTILLLSIIIVGCKNEVPEVTDEDTKTALSTEEISEVDSIVNQVKTAHAQQDFLDKEGVQFEIKLEFNGKERLNALLSMTTDSKMTRLDLADGGVIIYDGDKVWSSWENGTDAQARFDIFMWSYFFALPHKIDDLGTQVALQDYDEAYHKIHLSFDGNTGDTPDDWYDLFIDKETNLLDYAGYIVTYGGADQEEASKNAHAISYESYKSFDAIPVSIEWSFYNYKDSINKEEKIGQAVLSQMIFGKIDASLFQPEAGMHEVLLP